MPAIKLAGFRGEQPRIIPRLLPDSGAQAAVNSRLDDGGLTPIRKPLFTDDTEAGSIDDQTIYLFNGTWISWPGVVNAAPGPVDDTRLYYTGDGVPKMRKNSTVYNLKIALPAALTATLGGVGAGDVVSRVYTWTWVTDFGEESEPAPASNDIDWQPGNTVTLSGFTNAPAGRNITKQRIYRSQTGQSGTYFYLIDERAATNANYADSIAVDAFQEPLQSQDWNAPPDDLAGLTSMANGMMAAFVGRKVYFAEPFHPHAWPEKYVLTVDADIVALAALGTTLFVLTMEHPQIGSGSTPDSFLLQRSLANLPCLNSRGVSDMGFAICYPSNEGLVRANPDGSIGYVTASLFNRDEWQALSPATMIGAQFQGRFVGFFAVADPAVPSGGLIIDVGQTPFLARTNIVAAAAFFDIASSTLFYEPKGRADVWRYDDPDGARYRQYWKSKPFILPTEDNFGVIRVDSDAELDDAGAAAAAMQLAAVVAANTALLAAGAVGGQLGGEALNAVPLDGDLLEPMPPAFGSLQVGVYADGVQVATITRTNVPVRLPGGFRVRRWEIDVEGDVPITQIVMAKTMTELGQVP